MIVCNNCAKENPDDFTYCRYCGNQLSLSIKSKQKFWKRLPAWAWIIILVGGGIGIIVLMIGSTIALATIEGFASAIFLIVGAFSFGVVPLRRPEKTASFARAIGLAFFALMGATVDQTGNYFYNKPIEICLCEEGTSLSRKENVSNPVPGQTYIEQDFTCFDVEGTPVKTINIFAVIGIRFLEYILLGYLLLAIRSTLWRVFRN